MRPPGWTHLGSRWRPPAVRARLPAVRRPAARPPLSACRTPQPAARRRLQPTKMFQTESETRCDQSALRIHLQRVHGEEALLGRNADPQRKAVVPGAAMDVEPIFPERPEAVIRQRREGTHDGSLEPEPEKAELAAMGVAAQHEIRGALRDVTETARIVQHRDPQLAVAARMLGADARDVLGAPAEAEIDAEDLDFAGGGVDDRRFIDEQRHARARAPCGNDARGL